MNRRFNDLIKVAFSVGQDAENDFKVPFEDLNQRFFEFTKSHFGLVKRQKMSSQCLATTRQFAFLTSPMPLLGWSRGPKINWKSHVSSWNLDFPISNDSHFAMVKRSKMSSKIHGSPWNIAFSISPKSHFGLVNRKKMATTWNIAFSTSPKSNFGNFKI